MGRLTLATGFQWSNPWVKKGSIPTSSIPCTIPKATWLCDLSLGTNLNESAAG
jgi:hypothetical protein